MEIDLRIEPAWNLGGHVGVSSAFETMVVYEVDNGINGYELVERRLVEPFRKDYDELENPLLWPEHFDVSKWVLIAAFADGQRVGGAICAIDTPGVDILEGRRDLTVLWDLRVTPEARGAGVGSALFQAAEAWGRAKSCRELKVETQNVNVGACKLYQRHGCTLASATPGAYPELPQEVRLIWRKRLNG